LLNSCSTSLKAETRGNLLGRVPAAPVDGQRRPADAAALDAVPATSSGDTRLRPLGQDQAPPVRERFTGTDACLLIQRSISRSNTFRPMIRSVNSPCRRRVERCGLSTLRGCAL
jgi:hypothetical protein